MAVGPLQLGISAFCGIMAIMMIIFACVLAPEDSAYPHNGRNPIVVLPLVMYLFAPLPYGLCVALPGNRGTDNAMGFGEEAPSETVLMRGGQFFSGVFGSCGPCLVLVLWHTSQITGAQAGFAFASGVFLVGAVAVIAIAAKRNNADSEFAN